MSSMATDVATTSSQLEEPTHMDIVVDPIPDPPAPKKTELSIIIPSGSLSQELVTPTPTRHSSRKHVQPVRLEGESADVGGPRAMCQHLSLRTGNPCGNYVSSRDREQKFCSSHMKHPTLAKKSLAAALQKTDIYHSPCYVAYKRQLKQGHTISESIPAEPKERMPSEPEVDINMDQDVHAEVVSGTTQQFSEDDLTSSSIPSGSSSDGGSSGLEDIANVGVVSTEFLDRSSDSEEEDYFADTFIYTEEEVIKRRRDKIRRLLKLYQLQFHRLRDVIRAKHRKHFIHRKRLLAEGKLSLTKQHHIQRKQETEPKVAITNAPPSSDVPLIPSSPPLPQDTQVDTALVPVTPNRDTMSISEPFRHKLCVVSGCTARCLPPTNYCFAHILKDPKQKLFKACTYSNNGVGCTNPIFISQTPAVCPTHNDSIAAQLLKRQTANLIVSSAPLKRRRIVPEESVTEPSPPALSTQTTGEFPAQLVYEKIMDMVQCIETKRQRLMQAEKQDKIRFSQQLQFSSILAQAAVCGQPVLIQQMPVRLPESFPTYPTAQTRSPQPPS